MIDPPLTEEELVNAKWGLISPTQKELAITALYWYDEARILQIILDGVKEKNGN